MEWNHVALGVVKLTLFHKALAEMIGTFTIIFVGGGSIFLNERFPSLVPAYSIPIAWGLTIAVMILLLGPISGAHFNPAVTLAFATSKRVVAEHIWIYWTSQVSGGLIAMFILEAFRKL